MISLKEGNSGLFRIKLQGCQVFKTQMCKIWQKFKDQRHKTTDRRKILPYPVQNAQVSCYKYET